MTVSLILDRIEEGIAVLTDNELKVYECDAGLLPSGSKESAALLGEIDECGNITSLSHRENLSAGKNKSRLMELFSKNKNGK